MPAYKPGEYTPEEVDLIEAHLIAAPGASHNQAPMYSMPAPLMTPLEHRLYQADSHIRRCRWCGAHALNSTHCAHCRQNGYPAT